MERVAVVLGAGGITAVAWMLGAAEAIREQTGWHPADADVLCGTSAGSIAAVTIAARAAIEPLIRMAEDPQRLDAAIARATDARRVRGRLPLALPGSIGLGLAGLASSDPRRRLTSLIGFAPAGSRSGDEIRGLVHDATAAGWPDAPRLLLNATDYRTGHRVTFGADGAPEAPLAEAVAASAAVPGWYRPVPIGGRAYIDGGVVSLSNADVVAPYEPDLVICLSPFATGAPGGRTGAALLGPLRRAGAWQLRRETDRLRAQGSRVVTLEPTQADLRLMGLNVMKRTHARAVVDSARASVRAQLAGHPLFPRRERHLALAA